MTLRLALVCAALAALAAAQARPRVYVSASSSLSSERLDPQRDELVKTLLDRCPGTAVTLDRAKADFILDMQREPNKGIARKRNKWLLSDAAGDVVASGSDRSIGGVAQDACRALAAAHPSAR